MGGCVWGWVGGWVGGGVGGVGWGGVGWGGVGGIVRTRKNDQEQHCYASAMIQASILPDI